MIHIIIDNYVYIPLTPDQSLLWTLLERAQVYSQAAIL